MVQILPIGDNYIDEVIRSNGPYNGTLNKTQGVKLRELIKKLRDYFEQEMPKKTSDLENDNHFVANDTLTALLAEMNNTIAGIDTSGDANAAAIAAILAGSNNESNTLAKLYNLIQVGFNEKTFATVAERDAYMVKSLPFQAFVTDDGDGKWALYRAISIGSGANYVKISDPDLLNMVMSSQAIKAAYESNPDTNAFTTAQKNKLDGIAAGAEVNVNSDWNAVDGKISILNKPALFPPSEHIHTISNVTGLETALNNKFTGSLATDAETQVLTAVTEDNKVISRLKLFNWWAWVKAQALTLSNKLTLMSGTTTTPPLVIPSGILTTVSLQDGAIERDSNGLFYVTIGSKRTILTDGLSGILYKEIASEKLINVNNTIQIVNPVGFRNVLNDILFNSSKLKSIQSRPYVLEYDFTIFISYQASIVGNKIEFYYMSALKDGTFGAPTKNLLTYIVPSNPNDNITINCKMVIQTIYQASTQGSTEVYSNYCQVYFSFANNITNTGVNPVDALDNLDLGGLWGLGQLYLKHTPVGTATRSQISIRNQILKLIR